MIKVPALRRRPRVVGIAAATLVGLWALPAAADPSFDCAAASNPAEHMICEQPELAKLDQQIATVYFALLESVRPTLATQIRHEQRAFLRERNACSASALPLAACLDMALRARLADLQQLHTDHSGAPLVSGGEVVGAPGVVWRATRPSEIGDDALRLDDGRALCAVGLPDRPTIGTVASGTATGCSIARDGGEAIEPAFSILVAGQAAFTWLPARAAGNGDIGLDVWRNGGDRVRVCRAVLDDGTHVGTLRPDQACALLVGSGPEADEVLMLAGFDVLAVAE